MTDIYGSESEALSAENAFFPMGNVTMAHLDCLRIILNNKFSKLNLKGGSKDVCDALVLISEAIYEMQRVSIDKKPSGEPL
jgi:hypothetical protein